MATYRCSNGKDWVERDLLAQLAPRLRGAYLGGYDNTTQASTHARALELAGAEAASREDQPEGAGDAARAFEHIFIMRLDMALTRSNLTCLLAQDGPMTRSEAGNADGFSYLPGRFFACAVRARGALYYSHDWVASVLSLAGVDAPAAGAPVLYAHAVGGRAQDACAARAWRHEKRSAETAARWLRAHGRSATFNFRTSSARRTLRRRRASAVASSRFLAPSRSGSVITGVASFFEAAINSSRRRGMPSVTFASPLPAKWNVLRAICVDGSPTDCAATQPTASPGDASALR